jgi:hypothetical protein
MRYERRIVIGYDDGDFQKKVDALPDFRLVSVQTGGDGKMKGILEKEVSEPLAKGETKLKGM